MANIFKYFVILDFNVHYICTVENLDDYGIIGYLIDENGRAFNGNTIV